MTLPTHTRRRAPDPSRDRKGAVHRTRNSPRLACVPSALGLALCVLYSPLSVGAEPGQDPNHVLRLVPFPKQVQLSPGSLALRAPMTVTVNEAAMAAGQNGGIRMSTGARSGWLVPTTVQTSASCGQSA